ncbi:FecR family protein [Parapedobacter tibetensis]|uniref:FecR family protein n=1 Tax=Parapedobacter tibetensis TaxID=2972951 RepID=UPI00214D3134|nr:FecR domain-containing protein [Parapedobacter tibetensis]
MEKNVTKKLIRKYLNGDCTADEQRLVESWYLYVASTAPKHKGNQDSKDEAKAEIWQLLLEKTARKDRKGRYLLRIAASIAIALSIASYVYLVTQSDRTGQTLTAHAILPGSKKAMLILDDGSQLPLDSTARNQQHPLGEEGQYHIATPKGGEYDVMLADGTRVWLNAESSLSLTPTFNKNDRHVDLMGEAYFEVAKDPEKPFIVTVNELEIEVLGTHFNVTSYPEDQEAKTTLIEGSIKISKGGNEKVLSPGQQAIVQDISKDIQINNTVDPGKVTAWKDGFFEFKNDAIDEILAPIARWYQVEIVYVSGKPSKRLTGKIPRSNHFEEVLNILKYAGVAYELKGKELLIYPQDQHN